MLTLTRTSCWALPRGLTHKVIGNPVVPGYRLAISNRSSEVSLIAASPASPLYSTKPWGSSPDGAALSPEPGRTPLLTPLLQINRRRLIFRHCGTSAVLMADQRGARDRKEGPDQRAFRR